MKSLIVEAGLCAVAAGFNYGLARQLDARQKIAFTALTVWTTLSLSTEAADAIGMFDWMPGVTWVRAAGFCWFFASPLLILSLMLWRRSRTAPTDTSRRRFLQASAAVAVAPVVGGAFAISVARRDAVVREVDLRFANLPRDLEGLRIVQISDIHLGPFYSRGQLRRVVDLANGLRGDLMVVTGDLITSHDDPLDDALTEIRRLRAVAGIHGCHGNHELLVGAEAYATSEAAKGGIRFLRTESETLRFGSARINLAGIDYQRKGKPYLRGMNQLVQPGEFNLLLSHNPDVFPVAAQQGWDLTMAGHTHGGQITLEFVDPHLNPARFYTPYVNGEYEINQRRIFVTRGLGTVGVPMRVWAAPEIVVARLTRG